MHILLTRPLVTRELVRRDEEKPVLPFVRSSAGVAKGREEVVKERVAKGGAVYVIASND